MKSLKEMLKPYLSTSIDLKNYFIPVLQSLIKRHNNYD